MRIEQRIGRVDRIGQRRPVRAFNLVLENSVDQHVLRVLEEKLWRILEELGADKWNDVLEGASSRVEDLYAEAITNPERFEADVAALASRTREEVRDAEALRAMLTPTGLSSPGPRRGGEAAGWLSEAARIYERWSGHPLRKAVDVLDRLPEVAPVEPVPEVQAGIPGIWTLWEIRPHGTPGVRDCVALFVNEQGTVRPDLAERLWVWLARAERIDVGSSLSAEEWERVVALGVDYAYAACARLAPPETWRAPWLIPRLVVRCVA
jgi:hypothetical protein